MFHTGRKSKVGNCPLDIKPDQDSLISQPELSIGRQKPDFDHLSEDVKVERMECVNNRLLGLAKSNLILVTVN
jgi:hypothetical protein